MAQLERGASLTLSLPLFRVQSIDMSPSFPGLDGFERLLVRARKLVDEGKDLMKEFGKDLAR